MLDAATSERVKAQALRRGISVSAMASILIKSALDAMPDDDQTLGDDAMESKMRAIITLAEQQGLL